jgi:copper chaperone CopZ
MRKITTAYTAVLALLLIFSINSKAQIVKAEIRATGLTCSMCSNAINKQFKALPEVIDVETDLNTNTFIITLNETNELSPESFKEKVEKAGFFIGSLVLNVKPEAFRNDNSILVNDKKNNVEYMQFQVLEKGFVTSKIFKKVSKSYPELATYKANNHLVYHIKMLN